MVHLSALTFACTHRRRRQKGKMTAHTWLLSFVDTGMSARVCQQPDPSRSSGHPDRCGRRRRRTISRARGSSSRANMTPRSSSLKPHFA